VTPARRALPAPGHRPVLHDHRRTPPGPHARTHSPRRSSHPVSHISRLPPWPAYPTWRPSSPTPVGRTASDR